MVYITYQYFSRRNPTSKTENGDRNGRILGEEVYFRGLKVNLLIENGENSRTEVPKDVPAGARQRAPPPKM